MNNFYLIYGTDYSLIKREIDKITSGTEDVSSYDLSESSIDELLDDACLISMFGDKKVLIGENALFLTGVKTSVEHNIDYLTKYINDDNNENIVILTVLESKLDERKKIVKLINEKCKVIYKPAVDDKNLSSFVTEEFKSNGYKIDYKTANFFVDYVGKNVDILISEINKMVLYKEDDKTITKEDILDISSKGFKDNIFDLTDGIMKKDFKKVYECYKDLIIVGEDEIKIIALLGTQFTLIYQSKLLEQKGKLYKDIGSILDVHPYRVKLALETDFLIYELEDIIKQLHELDYKIKSGAIDKSIGLENFLLHL